MRTEELTKCSEPLSKLGGEVAYPLYLFKPPPPGIFYITDRSNVVLLIWFSELLVLVSVSVFFLFCV